MSLSIALMSALILSFTLATLFLFRSDARRLTRARRLIARGACLVDVDERAEFKLDHMVGAINIPFSDIVHRARELDWGVPLVIVGRGNIRAIRAARTFRSLGFDDVLPIGRARL
jgi:rhodanese-related sulfurtransferase